MTSTTTMRSAALAGIAVLLSLTVFAPALAQESDDVGASESTGDGARVNRFFLRLETWITQPSGADLTVGLRQAGESAFGTTVESIPTGTETRLRYQGGYRMPGDLGSIVLTWYATRIEPTVSVLTPSEFQILATNTAPIFQGAYDDGLSDGYQSTVDLTVRDLRLSYYREIKGFERVRARWFVGYRRFSHNRDFETRYYALAANFPPVLAPLPGPRPDLEPDPDRAKTRSEFSARGAEAGVEFDVPLWRDRVWMETGLALAAMRGKVRSTYESRTNFYAYRSGTVQEIYQDPTAPGFFEDSDIVGATNQEAVDLSITSGSEETGTGMLEGFIGFRWRFWKTLEATAGYRVYYVDKVSDEFRVTDIRANAELTQFNIVGFEQVTRSLTLEGYYVGLAATF